MEGIDTNEDARFLAKFKKKIKQFRKLTKGEQLTLGGLFFLLIALPVLVGISLQQIDSRFSEAQVPATPVSPPTSITPTPVDGNNPINWTTPQVYLKASNFFIEVNGEKFYANNANLDLHSVPGIPNYTTLETRWRENGVEMRLFMYFRSDGYNWWMYEMRTYNGQSSPDWITFGNPVRWRNLGSALMGSFDWWATEYETGKLSHVHMENLTLLPFWDGYIPTITPTPFIPQATLEFRPTSGSYNIGDTIQTGIYFNTKNIPIGGVAVRATYPFSGITPEVQVTSISVNPDFVNSGNWTCPTQNVQHISGKITIDVACANLTASGFATNSATLLSTLSLKVNQQPQANPLILRFDPTESVITRKSDGLDILAIPTATASFTITEPTPTPDCNFSGDTNCDQSVDILDYSILFASFGKIPGQSGYDPRANINHSSDGKVDILDYSVLYYNFGNKR